MDSDLDFFLLEETKGMKLGSRGYEDPLDESEFVWGPGLNAEKLPPGDKYQQEKLPPA